METSFLGHCHTSLEKQNKSITRATYKHNVIQRPPHFSKQTLTTSCSILKRYQNETMSVPIAFFSTLDKSPCRGINVTSQPTLCHIQSFKHGRLEGPFLCFTKRTSAEIQSFVLTSTFDSMSRLRAPAWRELCLASEIKVPTGCA